MRVLIVYPAMVIYGGAETLILQLCRYLVKNKIKVGIATLAISPQIRKLCKGVEIILPKKQIYPKVRSNSFINSLGIIKEILIIGGLVKEYSKEYDIINVHNVPAHWSAIFTKKPVIWMCNEPPDLWNNPNPSFLLRILRTIAFTIDRFIVRKFIDVICVADEFNAKRIFSKYCKKAEIIHYGIEYNLFSKRNKRIEKQLYELYELKNKFILLQVGMISPPKNQMESIKTVEKLRKNIPNIKLVLAGVTYSVSYEKILKKYIKQKKLKDVIVFTGHLSKEKIRGLYYISDVILQPVKFQGGWLAPFEAICAGKPVVVSSDISSSAIIKKAGIGIVTNDFVRVVRNIYNNPRDFNYMGKKGKEWVRRNLKWEIFSKKMLNLFKKYYESSINKSW